jgi:hypothetical protein
MQTLPGALWARSGGVGEGGAVGSGIARRLEAVMPTVRCPGCRRALSVPEGVLSEQARCPMCGRVFAVPSVEQERAPRRSAPGDLVTTAPREAAGPEAATAPDRAADAALRSGARWLAATLALQAAQALTCWLSSCTPHVSPRHDGPGALALCAAWHAAALVCLCAACREWLVRRRRPALLQACAWLLLLDAPLCGLAALLSSAGATDPEALTHPAGVLASSLAAALTGACELTAGVKVLWLLGRTDVRRAFR